MLHRLIASLLLIALVQSVKTPSVAQANDPANVDALIDAPPNIVIMLVDDAALMDFGAYGGEALTPNIDTLAARGAMFTQYRTSPLCSPSRAMLLTGMDNHLTGIATIPEVLPDAHIDQPGYSMSLEPGVLTLAERLKPEGYQTFMTGKWHMGSGKGDLPSDHGFDRSFALDASGADNWEDKSYMPFYHDAPWFEDGKVAALPDDFYSSEFIVDKMISYLDAANADAPFYAFLGFQAIHIPVQAPPEFTENYNGVYDQGWHARMTEITALVQSGKEKRAAQALDALLIRRPDFFEMPYIEWLPFQDKKWNRFFEDSLAKARALDLDLGTENRPNAAV